MKDKKLDGEIPLYPPLSKGETRFASRGIFLKTTTAVNPPSLSRVCAKRFAFCTDILFKLLNLS